MQNYPSCKELKSDLMHMRKVPLSDGLADIMKMKHTISDKGLNC